MAGRLAIALAGLLLTAGMTTSAQTDLDALMERVLARRDDNWKKLQQYVLNERETLTGTGPAELRVYGVRREYLWYPRDGRFIRSPVSVNGVAVGANDRERFERQFLERQKEREGHRAAASSRTPGRTTMPLPPGGALEPGFISAAYFLNFKFDPGQYALVGRDTYDGRDVLRIEYYPTRMFTEGRARPNREIRERDPDVERKMNKSALVTLWVLPEEHQIVKYDFEHIDLDFLPWRALARLEDVTAGMEMSQPFPGVWLPKSLGIAFRISTATGDGEAHYTSEYYDYRLADVAIRIR